MRILRPSGARKADLLNVVRLKQEVQVAACHPWGSCIWWSWRSPDSLLGRGEHPGGVTTKCVTNLSS